MVITQDISVENGSQSALMEHICRDRLLKGLLMKWVGAPLSTGGGLGGVGGGALRGHEKKGKIELYLRRDAPRTGGPSAQTSPSSRCLSAVESALGRKKDVLHCLSAPCLKGQIRGIPPASPSFVWWGGGGEVGSAGAH